MSRARVLQIITRLNVGGPAWMLQAMLERLDPSCFEVRLLAGQIEPYEADYIALRAPELPFRSVPGLQRSVRPIADARALAALIAEIRDFRPHLVHTHLSKAGVLGRLAARICGVPCVVHSFHGHLLEGYFPATGSTALRLVEQALARVTTKIVAEGARVRDQLLAAGVGRPEQYLVVRPGATLPPIPDLATARRVLGLPESGPMVLLPARLTTAKRPERFVEVARRLSTRHPDALFAVAGEGDLLEQLKAQAAPLGDRFRFLGFRRDLENLLGAADVVVLTSDVEGLPVVLVEAALAGRPVVATNVGSSDELVAHGATGFVTTTDVDEIEAAVDRLLADEGLRKQMGAAAAARAENEFSARRHVADIEQLYRGLLADRVPV